LPNQGCKGRGGITGVNHTLRVDGPVGEQCWKEHKSGGGEKEKKPWGITRNNQHKNGKKDKNWSSGYQLRILQKVGGAKPGGGGKFRKQNNKKTR